MAVFFQQEGKKEEEGVYSINLELKFDVAA